MAKYNRAKRVAPESGAFGPRFIMLIKDRARRDRMRRLSADSVVSRRDHAGPAQRIAAGRGGGDDGRRWVALPSRCRIAPPPTERAPVRRRRRRRRWILICFYKYCTLLRVPRSRAKRPTFVDRHPPPRPRGPCVATRSPLRGVPGDKRREGAPRKTRSRRNFLAPRYARV